MRVVETNSLNNDDSSMLNKLFHLLKKVGKDLCFDIDLINTRRLVKPEVDVL